MNIDNARLQGPLPTELPHGLARRRLELSWQKGNDISWAERLKVWGAKVVAGLTQGKAPQISSSMTDAGLQWRVYDPVGDRTHHFTTETEVRAWLEQRYYLDS